MASGGVSEHTPNAFTRHAQIPTKHTMKKLIIALLSAAAISAKASVIITYAEDPNVNRSSLSNTNVFDFNNLSLGRDKSVKWDDVGKFDQLYIKSADSYGGATDEKNPKGSRYSVQGAGTSVSSTTLKLDKDSSYFGLWWSAGDAQNLLEFYLEDVLVGQFSTASLMDPLPASYDGNPRDRSINSGEPYGFINFFADQNTAWDRIVLRNSGSSGFESDNYTSRVAAWDPLVDGALPGVPVSIVDGKKTTQVTSKDLEGTRWSKTASAVTKVPGAPLPPAPLLLAFGIVALVRKNKREATAA